MRTQTICLALAIVLLCPIASAQWVQTNGLDSMGITALAVGGTNIFAATDSGVYRSTDVGTSWTRVGFTDTIVTALAVSGKNLFVGTNWGAGPGRVYRSTNGGTSWTLWSVDSQNVSISCLAVSGTNIFAGNFAPGGGIFVSTDNGTNWTATKAGLPDAQIYCLAADGSNVYAGYVFCGAFASTDKGATWPFTWNPDSLIWSVTALAIKGEYLFAGSTFIKGPPGGPGPPDRVGVFRSTDKGERWVVADSGFSRDVSSFAVSGANLFLGAYNGGVFLSTNNGTNWGAVNAGLTDTVVRSLVISGTNLFAGTASSGVWRRPLSEMVTSVGPPVGQLPKQFSLMQNYPNPFNPTTVVKYQLPVASNVKLVVYDMIGREVSVLVNERRDAGVHEARFDGSNLASGVYFYRLQAGDFVQTKRLLLLK